MTGLGLHKKLEENAGLLIFGILFVSSIGGLVQVLPSIFQESLKTPTATTKPYSAVELTGRDIYIREACSVCHSQQIRPLLAEIKRYGPDSRAGESVYHRPFRRGSQRTGPDLHRVCGQY
ncbi:MAG: cbb3-type cytochrome c oxidase subunit II, partial [Gammaproteobacteria bacterium]|nr:cbb3-type cytochrome c oxidase subunit II [Gammaproteobacteria bacterium]